MDTVKIGQFLAQLRKEQRMTQEQLGEKLGVTNKTVSRWENGNYLPTVDMLQSLSELYGITINEILSAERLSPEDYVEKAEENIKAAISSSFTLKEKIDFYKKKWLRDHLFENMLGMLVVIVFLMAAIILGKGLYVTGYVISWFLLTVIQRNRMMAYVEARAFDGSGAQ